MKSVKLIYFKNKGADGITNYERCDPMPTEANEETLT